MTLSGRYAGGALVLACTVSVLAACGEPSATEADEDGLVDATPRALASVVVDHVGGDPRRETGHWSDWNDPMAIEAQIDYGEDPEGGGAGETRTVRTSVVDAKAYARDDPAWFHCTHAEGDRCEEEQVDGATVLYRWSPGVQEEEPGSFGWTVVRDDEVVTVSYEPSGYYDEDPRGLDVPIDPDDLRAAALDPAMSLRTTQASYEAGEALDGYDGVEERPEKPDVVPTTPPQLADRVADYVGKKPVVVMPSELDDFGPGAAGAHLVFPGTRKYDELAVDVITTVGRVRQVDPLPCKVQRSRTAARDKCFAWDDDTAATWTLAHGDEPGVLWIVGAQDDDKFNRIESVGIRVVSTGITQDFFGNENWTARFPADLLGNLYPLTVDLGIGPETRLAG